MPSRRFAFIGVLASLWTVSLTAQSITAASATYNPGTGSINWTFTLDEESSSAVLTHLVLGFDGPNALPDVFWDNVSNVSVSSGAYAVSKVDVWPDQANGISYLELDFDSTIALGGASGTYEFNYVTGGTQNLGNTADFFVSLYANGPANVNASLDGSLVATISGFSTSAVPEPSTYAALLGLSALGLAGWRRRRVRTQSRVA
jgi:hypothetical protein